MTRQAFHLATWALLLGASACGDIADQPHPTPPAVAKADGDSGQRCIERTWARSATSWTARFYDNAQLTPSGAEPPEAVEWPHDSTATSDRLVMSGELLAAPEISPRVGCDAEAGCTFSARWSKRHCFAAGPVALTLASAGEAELLVDNQLRLRVAAGSSETFEWPSDGRCVAVAVRYRHTAAEVTPAMQLSWLRATNAGSPLERSCGGDEHWRGHFFSRHLADDDQAAFTDPAVSAISFDWQDGAPAPTVAASFAARWTKTHCFAAGRYLFVLDADDDGTLRVDDRRLIDADSWHEAKGQPVAWDTAGGCFALEVTFVDRGGAASIELRWELDADRDGDGVPDSLDRCADLAGPQQGCPPPSCTPDDADDHGSRCPAGAWRVELWEDSLTPGISRERHECYQQSYAGFNADTRHGVEVLWGQGSPWPDAPNVRFASRWTRNRWFGGGCYAVRLIGDDGIRLGIDNTSQRSPRWVFDRWGNARQVVNETRLLWIDHGWRTLRLEHVERGGSAAAQLNWKRATRAREACQGLTSW